MGRKAKDLAPLAVQKLNSAGMHFVGHIAGLALRVSDTGARSWILRIMVGAKRRDIGLGAFPEVSLAAAKAAASATREQVRGGIDPLAVRRMARAALRAEQASFLNFEDAAKQYIAAHESGWKNQKHAAQWRTTLECYAYPVIGRLHVRDVALNHILKILEPIWQDKTETASRLRGRIEKVLDWAKARGLRSGENPAAWKGNLDALLPAPGKIARVEHHKACDWQEAPAFIKQLRQNECMGAKALEFLILTNVRSNNVRGARWSEIDLERAVWTIPADRMKAGKEHRVPLAPTALLLLAKLPRPKEIDSLVFPSSKGGEFSDMALSMLVRRMGKDFKVHGFRSTFRDWAGETTAFPREVIEHAMAHKLKDKSEAAYARGDQFTKRVALMKAWAEFLEMPVARVGKVISIQGKGTRHG